MRALSVLTLLILQTGLASSAFPASAPTFLTKWGDGGSGSGQFDDPGGIATDPGGWVYVADRNNHRIQKFSANGAFLLDWGGMGTGNGQFNSPRDVAVDADGFIYVADYNNNRIQKFTGNGTFVTKWGTSGTGDGEFIAPRAVTVDGSGYVYVTEDGFASKRVQKFTDVGGFVTKWGGPGSGDGLFLAPRGIAADDSGYIYVSDTLNDRIQKFTDVGGFVTKWGVTGTGNGQFNFPIGIAWGNGCLFVVDSSNHRIQGFDSGGGFQFAFGTQCMLPGGGGCVDPDGGGPLESGDGQFYFPLGVNVDGFGQVFVTDSGNNRVERFGPGSLVGVGEGSSRVGPGLRAFPNPARASATLRFRLDGPAEGGREEYGVRAEIFDVSGRLVHVLFSGRLPSGDHDLTWDGSTAGGPAAPGLFYARLSVAGAPARTAKILFIP